ncbi:CARDB domain-containing protein [Patulibacter brassicae]|uniref:CARDB domain-containing protein n=1 Tax=Patulibacter brassicae TaxID=1705717 RepID=A0ABU4VLX9_9ACTN|nr:CARDB domain-containing protein [Patulibacter brassicae]MDX8151951.1 CARDB domain-containing protein [Patulibacter brassicae]
MRRTSTLGLTTLLALGVAAPAHAATPLRIDLSSATVTLGSVRDQGGPATGRLTGTVEDDGRTVTIPASGIALPTFEQRSSSGRATITLRAGGPLTGTLDRAGRAIALRGTFDLEVRLDGLPAAQHQGAVVCRAPAVVLRLGTAAVSVPSRTSSGGAGAPVGYAGALDLDSGAVTLAARSEQPVPATVAVTSGSGSFSDGQFCTQLNRVLALPAALGLRVAGTLTAPGVASTPSIGGDADYGMLDVTPAKRRKPLLRVRMTQPPTVRPGRVVRVAVKVMNIGRGAATNVRLAVRAGGGVRVVRRTVKLGKLAAKRTRTIRIPVRTSSRTRTGVRVRVRLTADDAATRNRSTVLSVATRRR